MKGDFTRFTYDRSKHYRSVVMQQGRVQLDADWNENLSIQSHLLRTLTRDVVGECGVPVHVDAFKIGLPGTIDPLKPDFTISAGPQGQGRMYAGGSLCEIENDTTYLTQPDWSSAPAGTSLANLGPLPLGPLTAGQPRTDLVYIDVWLRTISAIEDPHIREVALGGPDTAERTKLIWQVKVKTDVGANATCDTPIGPAIGGGKMQVIVTTSPTPPDPCEPTAQGGYSGPDNRFYRVEVHTGGPLNTATFKWSRDDGSVAASIEQFKSATEVVVRSLGRDDYLKFKTGDFVEVSDDATDLSDLPGTLTSITVDEASRTLTLNTALPDAVWKATGRHPKVRRWDGGAAQTISGAVQDLEAGLKVQFTATADDFRTGDYWTFAARVVDGSIDPASITAQPLSPMGVWHTYCPLALITWTNNGQTVTAAPHDCRLLFPPLTELPTSEGCCTVSVGDGVTSHGDFTDIQAAVDALKSGGQVCILPGDYALRSPVKISGDYVIISGCGHQSHVIAPGEEPAFVIENSNHVRLESLFVTGQALQGLAIINDSRTIYVTDSEIVNATKADALRTNAVFYNATAAGPAITVSNSLMITLANNALFGLPAISLQAQIADVLDNRLTGGGIWLRDGSGQVRLLNNAIERGLGAGVILGGLGANEKPSERFSGVSNVQIVGNQIMNMVGSGISTLPMSAELAKQLGEITEVVIAGNRIAECVRSAKLLSFTETIAAGGVVLRGVSQARIHHNTIIDNGAAKALAACGVFVYMCEGLEVTDNTIVDNGSIADGGAQTECVDFTAMKPATGPNPLVETGATFTVTDANGGLAKETRIDDMKDFIGLFCDASTEIKLDASSPTVAVTIFTALDATRLEAFNEDGSSAGTYDVTPKSTQTITVTGTAVSRVVVVGLETWLLKVCFNTASVGFQAGIAAVYVMSQMSTTTAIGAYLKAPASLPPAGSPAAMIHDNEVVCPLGQALVVVSLGPTSVADNVLVSRGHRSQPALLSSDPTQAALITGLINAAGDVLIYNLGQPRDGANGFGHNVFAHFETGLMAFTPRLPDGRVSLHGNQVTFQDNTEAGFLGTIPVVVLTADDISVQDNQFLTETPQSVLLFDVFTAGGSVRASANRITELPGRAWLSYISNGQQMNIATGNQTTHCIFIAGAQTIDSQNQQLITTLCELLKAALGGK